MFCIRKDLEAFVHSLLSLILKICARLGELGLNNFKVYRLALLIELSISDT